MRRLSFVMLAFLACERSGSGSGVTIAPTSTSAPTSTTATKTDDGFIVDGLAGDGCSYPVVLGDVAYAPSQASLASIKRFLKNKKPGDSARVTYQLTGKQGTIQCGWGTSARGPEIEITSLTTPACPGSLRYLTTCTQCTSGLCARRVTACTLPCSDERPCPLGTCRYDGTCYQENCDMLPSLQYQGGR
jgi:hypothetical protein